MATATATASGGKWTTSPLSPALSTGKHSFRAFATEVSSLGNPEGISSSVLFDVNTEPPTVTLLSGPPARSNQTVPSFSGTASENTKVFVHVFEGEAEVAKAETTASGGSWSSSTLNKPLSTGMHSYRAFATEVSGLGNGAGVSNTLTFEVDTNAPTVDPTG